MGVLCLFYFVVIVCHAGFSEWFMGIWAIAGGGFLILWRMLVCQKNHPDTWLRFVTGAAGIAILLAVFLILVEGSKVFSGMAATPAGDLDYVIVLGARVRENQPTRALRKRLDKAMEYAGENPDTILILSGGQGPDEGISEARCMYNYMEEKGMDTSRLRMEDQSTSTLENLRFSASFLDRKKDRIGIVSNNFHIFRAMLLAKEEGYEQIWGIPAQSDLCMQPHYVLREICALLKLIIF